MVLLNKRKKILGLDIEQDLSKELLSINKKVQPVIFELLSKDVTEKNKEAVIYQCESGGKRIRPALVVIVGKMFGADEVALLKPAASIEILHNATLIIDDIIDHSTLRRGELTCWSKFGKSISECLAFDYIASVFAGIKDYDLVELYSTTLKTIVDGEIKDILFERSGREEESFVIENRYKDITKQDYIEMISQKTAVLLQTCCESGAICANANREQQYYSGMFGYYLGIAFQIQDDILDIFGDEKEFGKKTGKDIIEKKMGNFVILSTLEQVNRSDRDAIIDTLSSDKILSDKDVELVKTIICKTSAQKHAATQADHYISLALEALDMLPQNKYTQYLRQLAHYTVERQK